jgi:RNA polymerase sigma-70 factor (ECF subfamily)
MSIATGTAAGLQTPVARPVPASADAEARPKPARDATSDAHLVRAVVEGSHEALASLYDRHADAVYGAALRTTRDRWMAAEVVQETFLALWNRGELFDPGRGTLAGWLARIARNRAVDHLRAAGRRDRFASFSSLGRGDAADHDVADWLTDAGAFLAMAEPEPGPELALARKEARSSIADALASLPPLERRVIVMSYDDGLTQAEIADRTGWPLGTVKTRTRRALRRLREHLERPERPPAAAPARPGPASTRPRLAASSSTLCCASS